MALGFCMMMGQDLVYKKYHALLDQVSKGNFDLMDEMHHLSSGMKSVWTQQCMDGLMVVR